jgi:copper homeostasis protein
MRRDIEMCGECGVDGIVTGILLPGGNIDVERTAKLIEFAYPMSVTFHRAFDMCSNPVNGLEDIISTGAVRLLTSGQKNSAQEGIETIKKLVQQAGDRIIIMPGGGINESNAALIMTSTKAKELHLTGRKSINTEMIFRQQGVMMGDASESSEFTRKVADPETIKNIIGILKMIG